MIVFTRKKHAAKKFWLAAPQHIAGYLCAHVAGKRLVELV